MPARKTSLDYQALAKSKNFVWLELTVVNSHTKTWWQCIVGHKWSATYNDIQQGSGCPHCSGKFIKSPNDYQSLAHNKGFKWLGPVVTNNKSKTNWLCPQEHQWSAKYNTIQQGEGCPQCAGIVPKTIDNYKELALIRGFEWLGLKAATTKHKTVWRCLQGHEWQARYSDIQQGKGCPHCAEVYLKTPQDYKDLAKSRGFEWIGPEVCNVISKTNWMCSKGHKWLAQYHDICKGSGCPRCVHHISKPEIQLREAIKVIYPDTQGNVRELLSNKRFELDIYIPSLKKAIEYDGWAHTHYKDAPARDARKNRECEEAGIQLLRVSDREYRQNPEAITTKVLEWLGQPQSTL